VAFYLTDEKSDHQPQKFMTKPKDNRETKTELRQEQEQQKPQRQHQSDKYSIILVVVEIKIVKGKMAADVFV
jgi:hypothetical protein